MMEQKELKPSGLRDSQSPKLLRDDLINKSDNSFLTQDDTTRKSDFSAMSPKSDFSVMSPT